MYIYEKIYNNGNILLNELIFKVIRICMYVFYIRFGEEVF